MNINFDEGLRARHGDDAEAADLEGDDVIRHIAPAMKVRAQGGVNQIDDIAQKAVRVHIVDFKGTIVASGERCAAPKLSEFLAHLQHVAVLRLAIFERIHQGADEKNASPAFVQIGEIERRHGLQIESLPVIEHLDA